ncbi:MAG: cytochrome c oxidase subunit 3 [Acidobacteria bacterium]|nr:cytochrome c oxidase subunit 3 [Acidobacteriota bacterium]
MQKLIAEREQPIEIAVPAYEAGLGRAVSKGFERVAHAGSEPALPYTNADLGLWGLLATVTMLFAGFTSAYLVRRASGDWQSIAPPSLLYLNTVLLVMSSVAVELGRNSVRSARSVLSVRSGRWAGAFASRFWMAASLALAFAFLGGQILAWRQLEAAGIFLPTSPHSSFFYLLRGLHGVHLAGGVFALLYAFRKTETASTEDVEPAALRLCATYWHFLTGVWLYLFFLLFVWR